MPRSAPPVHRRRLRTLATAGAAALVLPLLAAAPAAAQTAPAPGTTITERTAATQAAVLRLTVNLPQETQILLDINPVSGTVKAVTGSSPEAEALATLITGSIAGNAQSFPGAEARLPEPTESSGPTSALADGINSSPLGAFLNVGALSARAAVTDAPSSTSTAQIANLGLGLPQELNDALQQVLDPLLAGLDDIIAGLEPVDEGTQALCEGIEPVTGPVSDGVSTLPGVGPILSDTVDGVTDAEAGLLCNLRIFLGEVSAELGEALADLTGPGGVVSTGLLTATQSITTEGDRTTARSQARAADVEVLGVNPFGTVRALDTTSTATIDGATSDASFATVAVESYAEPLLTVETDLSEVTGDLAGIDLDGLDELLAQIQLVLDGLAGIQVVAGPLDDADAALDGCPEDLAGQLTGTFEAPGTCAAAAARGYGLAITAPAELAGPLGITGPLVALQISPTAAVVRAASTTTPAAAPPAAPPPSRQLPRTGAEAPLAAAGAALLLGAALLRRRRAALSA